jgi:hypothetical protein
MAPTGLLKDYQITVDVVNDGTEGDYGSSNRPGSYVRDIVGSDQQVYGDDRTTSKSNSI